MIFFNQNCPNIQKCPNTPQLYTTKEEKEEKVACQIYVFSQTNLTFDELMYSRLR